MLMSNYIKPISKASEYYIPHERHLELIHFCRQYNSWHQAVNDLNFVPRVSENEIHSTDPQDCTSCHAIQLARYNKYLDMVKSTVYEATKDCGDKGYQISRCLLKDVTEGHSYATLFIQEWNSEVVHLSDICSEYSYRRIKQKFFWLLDKARD